ncbi:MAG: hypothetical protein Kow0069_16600 [Promethearchaeota archaeon]
MGPEFLSDADVAFLVKPPICAICGERFDPSQGALIYFRRTAADEEWHERRRREPGFVGHPPEAEWFCGKHARRASELSNLTIGEAFGVLRREFSAP